MPAATNGASALRACLCFALYSLVYPRFRARSRSWAGQRVRGVVSRQPGSRHLRLATVRGALNRRVAERLSDSRQHPRGGVLVRFDDPPRRCDSPDLGGVLEVHVEEREAFAGVSGELVEVRLECEVHGLPPNAAQPRQQVHRGHTKKVKH